MWCRKKAGKARRINCFVAWRRGGIVLADGVVISAVDGGILKVYVKFLICGQADGEIKVAAIIYIALVLAEQLGSNHARLV
ncbi:hypothetical protein ACFX1T_043294 [Malus domestica]